MLNCMSTVTDIFCMKLPDFASKKIIVKIASRICILKA